MALPLVLSAADPKLTHQPQAPRSHDPVTVTAHLPTGGSNAVLRFQTVDPGAYLRLTDPAFTNTWQSLAMTPRNGAFEVVLPGEIQRHRRLVRYALTFEAADGEPVRWPAVTNDCPNLAYFVYDGVPDWTGASEPGRTAPLTFPAAFMRTLPTYHLLAVRADVERSQWDGSASKQRFPGTLVFGDRVYDHIQFHNRGRASIYNTGKNKWGFKFRREDPFHALDLWGRPYPATWTSLSLTACASPWVQANRGMAGMDEAASFRAYQLAGVPSSPTHWISLRVITGAEEAPAADQYGGDLWGLYLVVEEPGAAWLRDLQLPDGDIYYPEAGLKHRARGSPENDEAYQKFIEGPPAGARESWWRSHLDLPRFHSFNAMNRLLSNVDLRPGENHYLYHGPDDRWTVVPWDLDMMFIPRTHQPGYVDQIACLDQPQIRREFQNRAREIVDLFCTDPRPDGGQFGQLVEELSGFLVPAGQTRSWPELDECLWNHHPRSQTPGQFYRNPVVDGRMGGVWTRRLATADFAGFCRYLVEFATDSRPGHRYEVNDGDQRGYGFGYLTREADDPAVPPPPVVRLLELSRIATKPDRESDRGKPTASKELRIVAELGPIRSSSDAPAGALAVQWRIGRISAPGVPGYQAGQPRAYEIEDVWRSSERPEAEPQQVLIVGSTQPGHSYRLRARRRDADGRWSHWSAPIPFVAP